MPTYEGKPYTGWLVLFTPDETKRIAAPVADYGSPIVALTAFIPEPMVTKAISLGASALTLLAKKAAQKDKALSIYVKGVNPFRLMFARGRVPDWRNLFAGMPLAPFFFDDEDPESLMRWRRALGMWGERPLER